jgi:hypothetical protein
MAIRRFSIAEPGVKSNKFWDQDTAQGAIEPIATITLNAQNVTTFQFTSIPQTYNDLMMVVSARNTTTSTTISQIIPQFNNDGATTYSYTVLRGTGSGAVGSFRSSNANFTYGGSTSSGTSALGIFGSIVFHILDYKNTTKFKTLLERSAIDLNGSGEVDLAISTWRNTAAINTISIGQSFGTVYAPGSTATLYGIKAGV